MRESLALAVSEAGHLLLVAAVAVHCFARLFPRDSNGCHPAWLGVALVAMLSAAPVSWNPTFYTRAAVGDLGALGFLYLLHLFLRSLYGRTLLRPPEFRALAIPALLGAALIYPASLGVPGWPDYYNSDFGGYVLPSATLLLAVFYLWRGFFVAAAGAGFGLFLYGLALHESANLWDCLIDFPSVVVSAIALVKWSLAHRRLRSGEVESSMAS